MLELNDWQWKNEMYDNGERMMPGFAVKAGNVLDLIWRNALGFPPSRRFKPEVEYPGL